MWLNGKIGFLKLIVGVFILTLGCGILFLAIALKILDSLTNVEWISISSVLAIAIGMILLRLNVNQ